MENNSRDIHLEKKIDAYIKGQLAEEEAEELWIKLLSRPEYIDFLETDLAVKKVMEEKKKYISEPPPSTVDQLKSVLLNHSWKWFSAAAVIILLVVSITVLDNNRKSVEELGMEEINIVENLASPEIVRSRDSKISSVDSLMNIGFNAALSGKINEAVTIYEQVITNFPEDPVRAKAYMNIGIIQYNDGEYQQAAEAFTHALQAVRGDRLVKEKAYWYLGNSYLRMEDLEKAGDTLRYTYKMDGIFRDSAARLLKKLDSG